jgi:peptidoglycan/xylan/chitin deacetylase (PgdA/CDA1 family)
MLSTTDYMFYEDQIRGNNLPAKTICLTFDDGPGETPKGENGPQTLKLAEYLFALRIPATFFVTGKHADEFPETLKALPTLGHTLGNHTYSHPHLVDLLDNEHDVFEELLSTYDVIKDCASTPVIPFRAPWGEWSSGLCEKLNSHELLRCSHKGPYFWDVTCQDWNHWKKGKSAQECAQAFYANIRQRRHGGITIMHDSSADDYDLRKENKTFELIKLLIPKLIRDGYKFVPIWAIP